MTDYNAFIQANTNVVKVYAPKSVRLNGGSVLAPYQITRGTLPSIAMSRNAGGVLVSDIAVGSLVIGEETTVADLANVVMALNEGWEAGDQLTFFYGVQTVDAVTGIPRARIYGWKVILNPGDETLLADVVSPVGFTVADGCLAMDRAIANGAAVWVHSRLNGTSGVMVSTQFMYVDSALLASYQGAQAMAGAANSYGGVNASAVYLNPRSGASRGLSLGPGSGAGGNDDDDDGGGSGSGSGGGSGSGSGGSETGGGSGSGSGEGGDDEGEDGPPMF